MRQGRDVPQLREERSQPAHGHLCGGGAAPRARCPGTDWPGAPPPRRGGRGPRAASGRPAPAAPPAATTSGRRPARPPGRSGPPCRRRPARSPPPTSEPRVIRTTPKVPSPARQSAIRPGTAPRRRAGAARRGGTARSTAGTSRGPARGRHVRGRGCRRRRPRTVRARRGAAVGHPMATCGQGGQRDQLAGLVGRRAAVVEGDVVAGRDHHHQVGGHPPRPLGPAGLPVGEVGHLDLHRGAHPVDVEGDRAVGLRDVGHHGGRLGHRRGAGVCSADTRSHAAGPSAAGTTFHRLGLSYQLAAGFNQLVWPGDTPFHTTGRLASGCTRRGIADLVDLPGGVQRLAVVTGAPRARWRPPG